MSRKDDEKGRRGRRAVRRFTISMQRKLAVLFVLVLLAFVGLGIRLFLINRDNGAAYSMQVLSQQAYDNTLLPYKRGKILDSKGTVLADSQLVYNVIVDSMQILEKDAYLEPTLDALEYLGIDRGQIRSFITSNPGSQYYIALKNIPYSKRRDYLDWVEEGKKAEEDARVKSEDRKFSKIMGIWFEPGYLRSYPHGALASDVLGFSSSSGTGYAGLEKYYDETLRGVEGRQYGYLDESLSMERTTIDATDGNNLILTIDANIQSICEKYLQAFIEEHRDEYHYGNGANNVGCIIMEVDTGNVLAMASAPSFDAANPYDIAALAGMPKLDADDENTDTYLTYGDLITMSEDEKPRYLNALWKNFCISDYFEPGSTVKPFTVAAGLETGTVHEHDTFTCNGSLNIDGFQIKCHNTYGDGVVDVSGAVERSCNVALMEMAMAEGKEIFGKFQRIFNFSLRTGIDLADEARTDQFLHDPKTMTDATLATNAFGQNFNATMIQMITGFCSLINGGNYYEPHVVSRITSPGGVTISTTEPRLLKKTISEDTSELIREFTLQVVEGKEGTGSTARPAGYRIGGKTGTAETLPRGNDEYIVSFMGYAPYEDPKIAIYVVVDRPNVEYQADARYATQLVRQILTEVLPYMDIYMTVPVTDEERRELDALGLVVTYGGEDQGEEESTEDSGEEEETSEEGSEGEE